MTASSTQEHENNILSNEEVCPVTWIGVEAQRGFDVPRRIAVLMEVYVGICGRERRGRLGSREILEAAVGESSFQTSDVCLFKRFSDPGSIYAV